MSLAAILQQAMQQQGQQFTNQYDQLMAQGRKGAVRSSGADAGWQEIDMGNNQLYLVNPNTKEVRRAPVMVDNDNGSSSEGYMAPFPGQPTSYDAWGLAPSKDNFLDKYSLALVAGGFLGPAAYAAGGVGGAMPGAVAGAEGAAGLGAVGDAAIAGMEGTNSLASAGAGSTSAATGGAAGGFAEVGMADMLGLGGAGDIAAMDSALGLGGAGAGGLGAVADGGAMDMFGSQAIPGSADPTTIMQGAGTSGASGIQGMLNQMGLGGITGGLEGGGGLGSYQFPYAQVLGGLLGAVGSNQQAKTLESMMQKAIDSDQWRTQQPKYFDPLHQATTQGIGNTAYGQSIADATARKSASMGYNMSGNQMHDVAQGLNKGSIDYINAVRPMAMGNGGMAQPIAQMGSQIANAQQNTLGNLGYGLGSIVQGQQPTGAQQVGGTQPNKSLIDVFKSVSL